MFTDSVIWYTNLIFHYKEGNNMATKNAAASAKKKTTVKKPLTSTKVTTVKAVESPSARNVAITKRSGFSLPLGAAMVAEFIGTFLLASVALLTQGNPLYVGFALVGIVLAVGAMSGAHVNPLVTVGAWATRRINGLRALMYLVAQILGGLAALGIMSAFIGGAPKVSPDAAAYGQQASTLFEVAKLVNGKEWFLFFAELLGASVFGFAVANALRENKERISAAFTVGLGLFSALIIASVAAGYVGGNAVVNPAVALTLTAIDWNDFKLWSVAIYVIAPLVGGVAGFFLHDILKTSTEEV
jgi:glycerol uptake facilitator-like aquaporin